MREYRKTSRVKLGFADTKRISFRAYSAFLTGLLIAVTALFYVIVTPTASSAWVEDPAISGGCDGCHNVVVIGGNTNGTNRLIAYIGPGTTKTKARGNWTTTVNNMVNNEGCGVNAAAAIAYLNTCYCAGCSNPNPEGVSCLGSPPTNPDPPSNLISTVRGWTNPTDWTTIDLIWNDNSDNEDGFRIERCEGSGCTSFAPIATVGAGVTAHADTGLLGQTIYRYQVVAFNAQGDSSPNPIDEATTGPDNTVPSAPGTPNVFNEGDGTSLRLVWSAASDPESGIDHYVVYRDNVAVISGGCSDPTGTPCIDGGLTEAVEYCYEISAVNKAGAEGPLSSQACGTPVVTLSGSFSSVLVNGSIRTSVQTGNDILIGDLIIEGDSPMQVLLRARGPALGAPPFNLPGVLGDPVLQLVSGGTIIAQSDNWQTTNPQCDAPAISCGVAQDIINTGLDPCQPNPGQSLPPTNCNLEAAMIVTLPPGAYNYLISGSGGTTGIGLGETFNLDGPNLSSKLIDLSGRGLVGTGDNQFAGGFVISGNSPMKVFIRGRGPSLGEAPFNLSGVLADSAIELYSGATMIASNDNWQTTGPLCVAPAASCGDAQDIINTGLDPCQPNPGEPLPPAGCNLESGIIATLPPGSYGTFLKGANGETGLGLVEVFDVDSPKMVNISTRSSVQTGDNIMVGGIWVSGTDPKTVLLRARGPALAAPPFNLPGTLANPLMQLFSGATMIAQNDNWQTTDLLCDPPALSCGDDQDIITTGLDPCQPNPGELSPPTNCDLESTILVTLPPGGYTAQVSGVSGGTGIGIVEAFDVGSANFSQMVNISTRAKIETGDSVEIAGFWITGSESKKVLIRARGPALAAPPFNLPGTLANPTVQLFSGATAIAQNNDWQNQTDPTCGNEGYVCGDDLAIIATGLDPCQPNPGESLPPANCNLESVVLITLPPGGYTAQVSGVSGGTGVGIVEVFEVE